jgi:hypothetical protein
MIDGTSFTPVLVFLEATIRLGGRKESITVHK